jgi:hypothetical protein
MHLMSFRLPENGNSDSASLPEWRDSIFICALADTERHLGHVIKRKDWHAYDAIHTHAGETGFKDLGRFADLAAAKRAVESAVGTQWGAERVMHAGTGMSSFI